MGEHNEIRFNVILKYCVVKKFQVVVCTTVRNCQRCPMPRKDKIFDSILILIISILPTLTLIYIDIDFCFIFQTLTFIAQLPLTYSIQLLISNSSP